MPTDSDTPRDTQIPDWLLLLTVFITGACILIIELIGTRVLAPFFGSGIYTWSALIAVTLAALAAGYAYGGRFIDKHPKSDLIFYLCLIAGVWTLITPSLAMFILPELALLSDIRLGILVSSIVLFAPNLFTLGMASPFVIRLLTHKHQKAGTTSGLVFSISTLGSLLAALATGFFLMPNFGVLNIFMFCGTALIVIAMTGLLLLKKLAISGIALALTTLCIYNFTLSPPTSESSLELIDSSPSFYGHVQVVRKNGYKILLVDGIGQNYVTKEIDRTLTYINFLSALPKARPTANTTEQTALIIGLGAGQLPVLLEKNDFNVETVEIDPVINIMARKHFGFDQDAKQIHLMDGRLFLSQSSNSYDFIIIDAFNADSVASHLLSKQAVVSAQSRLKNNGILAINTTSMNNGEDIKSIKTTLSTAYQHVRVFSERPDSDLSNVIFIASDSPIKFGTQNPALTPSQRVNIGQYLAGELTHLEEGLLLSDDYNPLAYQREQAQQHWRMEMRNFLGEEYYHWVYL